jgi:hypothetical protein
MSRAAAGWLDWLKARYEEEWGTTPDDSRLASLQRIAEAIARVSATAVPIELEPRFP